MRHGAKVKVKRCSSDGCTKKAQNGGVCVRHGAKVKLCSSKGCTKYAQTGGVCIRHGAKIKRCSSDECENFAVTGGVCVKHGAKWTKKNCSVDGCTKLARRGGVCMRHGTYKNPLDESTAFAPSHRSVHDKTSASLPNYPVVAASTNQEQGRDPPSVIVCRVIDYVEV